MGDDPNRETFRVRDVNLPVGLTDDRFMGRRDLRKLVDTLPRFAEAAAADPIAAVDTNYMQGYELISSVEAQQAFDVGRESDKVRDAYGRNAFGQRCLLARRLVERGVRFVQLYDTNWDHHGGPTENLETHLPAKSRDIDQACAGLILDLKQRGLLDETIVVWGGEFGRTPMGEVRESTGRNHHIDAFTMWFAGGGFKPGLTYGKTDDFGFGAVENPVHVHDIHATLLHQLGRDHERLSVRSQGLDFRLTGVDPAHVVKDLLA